MDIRSLRYFVAVAEERHFGRAAARLHISQPPLSRCIRALESDLGAVLLLRSPSGVALTPAGASLYDEARSLLARADQVRDRVVRADRAVTVGVLADSAEQLGPRLVTAYRSRHPEVEIRLREADLTDPTAGLRAGLVDVALTRTPFDERGIGTRVLRSDPLGVVVRADDPLAGRARLGPADIADRRRFRLPEGTDPIWQAFWSGRPDGDGGQGPVVRTVRECLQAILWNGTVGVLPMVSPFPDGLVAVPLDDTPPSDLVVAWAGAEPRPLIRSFIAIALAHRDDRPAAP